MKTPEALCAKYNKLTVQDGAWLGFVDDVYTYVQPYREQRNTDRKGKGENSRVERIFDATAVASAQRGPGRLQRAITPNDLQWFLLKPGPLVADPQEKKRKARFLEQVSRVTLALFQTGGFSTASAEMYQDLFASMGCLLVLKGDTAEPVKFACIPQDQIFIEDDTFGQTRLWLWKYKSTVQEFVDQYKDHEGLRGLGDLEKIRQDDPEKLVEFLMSCERLGSRKFVWRVSWYEEKKVLVEEELRSSPFITPRMFKLPGEHRGRGPIMMAMPHIKTLNKSAELQLKAAAFALLGLWMMRHDGKFNPRIQKMVPGAFLRVKSTGGPMGADIQRLPMGEQFDLTMLINDQLRSQIKEMLFDLGLPDSREAVKSPTEIIERLKRLAEDIGSAFGRLQRELVVPLVQRVLDILADYGLLGEGITIDDLLTKVQVTSPLASAQALQEVEKVINWITLMMQTGGEEQVNTMLNRDRFGDWLAEMLGITMDVINTPEEREAIRKVMAEEAKAAMAAAMQEEVSEAA